MGNIRIYFSVDTEFSEYEFTQKGYRIDVYAKVGEELFNIRVYTLVRLQQDFIRAWEICGEYMAEPNLVIVRDTSKDEIIRTVYSLFSHGFFKQIKPVEGVDTSELVWVNVNNSVDAT